MHQQSFHRQRREQNEQLSLIGCTSRFRSAGDKLRLLKLQIAVLCRHFDAVTWFEFTQQQPVRERVE
jgi:hypothetical protein